jgi:hypothetical protein
VAVTVAGRFSTMGDERCTLVKQTGQGKVFVVRDEGSADGGKFCFRRRVEKRGGKSGRRGGNR